MESLLSTKCVPFFFILFFLLFFLFFLSNTKTAHFALYRSILRNTYHLFLKKFYLKFAFLRTFFYLNINPNNDQIIGYYQLQLIIINFNLFIQLDLIRHIRILYCSRKKNNKNEKLAIRQKRYTFGRQ